ncbi:chromobox protein homolog 2-like isoform X2 [Eleginops maclovinus]|uniref:chromobox protein homolog 2-like isoform X2 n=1 Tax=Eleginops maclovinus TaxID=56733 RepID=UPI003080BF68
MEGVTVGQVFDAECILSKRPRKGKCEYLVKWRGWSSKEQEKELLFQTKGKRPRGRPRKILPVPALTKDGRSSSSSCSGLSSSPSSSSSSSEDEEDSSKKPRPAPRLQPGPVKRPQILLSKPDPPKKKRGRKPLHPDVRALRQAKSRLPPASPPLPAPPPPPPRHQVLRPPGVKKPLQPASFTYTGLGRSREEAASSQPSFASSKASLWTSSSSSSSSYSRPSKNSDLKAVKMGVHGGFGGALSLRRPDALQHKQLSVSKATTTPRERANQALNLRALNLQSVRSVGKAVSGSGLQGGSRASLRSGAVGKGGGIKVQRAAGGVEAARLREELADGQTGSARGAQTRSLNELSTGDSDESSSDSEPDSAAMFPAISRPSLGDDVAAGSDTETDWRPERSLLEQVCVTDVTANFITVTVKESPTSEGFFSSLSA